jgi:hypothetical protein
MLKWAIHDNQTNSHIELAAPTSAPNHSYVCMCVFVEFRVSLSPAKWVVLRRIWRMQMGHCNEAVGPLKAYNQLSVVASYPCAGAGLGRPLHPWLL